MAKGLFKLLTVIFISIIAFPASGKKRNDSMQSYLETKINRQPIVEGEMLIYEVILHTPDPDIVGVELVRNPDFSTLPVSRAAAGNSLNVSEENGVRFYSAVIDRFFIDAAEKGKHKLQGGQYNIGHGKQVTVNDPFWGPYITESVERESLRAPDLEINIEALPSKRKPEDFSGAVGNFTIEVSVPEGEIQVGKEALAIVTIVGDGNLSKARLPQIQSLFNDNLKFKSMTETRDHFVKEGVIGTEIEMECTFVAQEEGEFELGKCSFSFYNPKTREYQRVESKPVSVLIRRSGVTKDSTPQYIQI